MHLILWIIVGILAGALANRAPQGEGPWGVRGDVVVGLLGGIAGGLLFQSHMSNGFGGWIGSTLVAFFGAVAVLLLLRFAIGWRTA